MVRWSRAAKQDLKQIFDFISTDSKYYAQKVVLAIIEKSDALEKFPYRGRIVPERNEERIRELLIYSYRMIYQINMEISKFWHLYILRRMSIQVILMNLNLNCSFKTGCSVSIREAPCYFRYWWQDELTLHRLLHHKPRQRPIITGAYGFWEAHLST